ncbi:MAG: RluA family pseudouridine synthase, partial [Clostridia bacterium]|nr:RluA family pseudouridine synthase [Clostridia bacterium]
PTGVVMVFAKTSKGAARLSEQMKNGGFEKRYLAVLCGVPSRKQATLENYLRKSSVNNTVYVCTQTEEGAKFAALDYEIKEEHGGLSLAEIKLHTGRTHQIRVQMASINCPLYGDMRYGGEKAVKGKLALWAYSLRLTHPVTGEKMRFEIEPPKEEGVWKNFNIEV